MYSRILLFFVSIIIFVNCSERIENNKIVSPTIQVKEGAGSQGNKLAEILDNREFKESISKGDRAGLFGAGDSILFFILRKEPSKINEIKIQEMVFLEIKTNRFPFNPLLNLEDQGADYYTDPKALYLMSKVYRQIMKSCNQIPEVYTDLLFDVVYPSGDNDESQTHFEYYTTADNNEFSYNLGEVYSITEPGSNFQHWICFESDDTPGYYKFDPDLIKKMLLEFKL